MHDNDKPFLPISDMFSGSGSSESDDDSPEPAHRPEPTSELSFPDEHQAAQPAGDYDPESYSHSATETSNMIVQGVLAGAVVLVFLLILIATVWSRVGHYFHIWWGFPVLALIAVVLSYLYGSSVYHTTKRQTPTPLQLAVEYNPDHLWAGEDALFRLRHKLAVDREMPEKSETMVYLLTRLDGTYAFTQMRRPLIIFVVVFGLLFPTGLIWTLPFILIAVFVIGMGLWTVVRYQSWNDWYFMLTDKRAVIFVQHNPWLWWMKAPKYTVPLSKVNTCNCEKQSIWGNRRGYMRVIMNVEGPYDFAFNDMKFMPHAEVVVDLVSMLIAG